MNQIKLDPEFEYLRKVIKPNLNAYGYALVKGGHFLHHYIAGQPLARKVSVVDHINCDKLDNRRDNLRIVSRRINALSTSSKWSDNGLMGRGYYLDTRISMYVLHNDFAPYFSHKDELTVARMFEYYARKEDTHYPSKFEPITNTEFKKLTSGRKIKSKPGERILVTFEKKATKGKNKGKLRFRFDFFIEGVKTRCRESFVNKTETRKFAYRLLKLHNATRIDYNWK